MRRRHLALPLLVLALAACGTEDTPNEPTGNPVYETTLTLQAPVVNPEGIDRIVFRWSTNANTVTVNMDNLVGLVVELYSGSVKVYADTVRAAGAYRPMGGIARSGLTWSYAFGTDGLREVNNALIDQQNQASGTQYIVSDGVTLQTDQRVYLRRTVNGSESYLATEQLASQATVIKP